MTYRRFCTPAEVMREFHTRIKEVETGELTRDVQNWALIKWVVVELADLE
jgi:hypothetical protein